MGKGESKGSLFLEMASQSGTADMPKILSHMVEKGFQTGGSHDDSYKSGQHPLCVVGHLLLHKLGCTRSLRCFLSFTLILT